MKSNFMKWVLGSIAVFFLLSSLIIALIEYNRFSNEPFIFPAGSTIGDIPVGGLDQVAAQDRLGATFSIPLVIVVNEATLQVRPEDLGFSIAAADLVNQAVDQRPNSGFWAHLWNKQTQDAVKIPLQAVVNEAQILDYLKNEIAPRYAQSNTGSSPIPCTTNFTTDGGNKTLDLDRSVEDIAAALVSPSIHQVTLTTIPNESSDPDFLTLAAFLQQNINCVDFDELVEVYVHSFKTEETLHFALMDGNPVEPDVAFTAASTIKIPIMVSILRRTNEPTPEAVVDLLERMIVYSENPPADTLMATYLDQDRGPLIVSEDLSALGMENSFLAGYFALGSPVLQLYTTPANTRTDIYLDPDVYNQTVPSEIGQLLTAIYTCAADGSGLLTETFPGEITPSECQLMMDILSANKIGMLIEGGLGPDALAAHKHGWVQELDGLLHSMSDVAIVFSPGGDYVLCIFVYDPERLDFDQGNRLITRLSQTVYNFFNIENQQYWWFD
jgi:beta-lactamase class A